MTWSRLLKRLTVTRARRTPRASGWAAALRMLYAPTPAPRKRPSAKPGKTPRAPGADDDGLANRYVVFEGTRRRFKLHVPVGTNNERMPVLVMLHGCQQDAADFARGTRMNALADTHRFIVAYPEQTRAANSMRCWNWFDRRNQKRSGEAALIAAVASHVVRTARGDASRIYVAGLSAGGAMAMLVAQQYPEVFAAAGVHSGLVPGVAGNAISALHAMKRGPSAAWRPAGARPVPLIAFHGLGDSTVHPRNGQALVQAAEQAVVLAMPDTVRFKRVENHFDAATAGRPSHRSALLDSDGVCWVESWIVEAAPHAWSGGSARGSYTDPTGPDASALMVDFLLRHRRAGQGA